ncbi:TetR family transcriptional regulator [Allorhizobium pseudoryzae]|jgi:AcrR family transcriptional regulator|uniref:TetR family transcriptional regulator n=1 Tax=Allorhizobium pseudoryzae TaxID=379684 RepID=UPI003D02020A
MEGSRIKAVEGVAELNRTSLRRVPKQDRSRERIDEILKVAMELIGKKGIDAVTMKEIASLSGGPIASVYQYFPNKSAIIATLYDRYLSQVKSLLARGLEGVHSPADVGRAAEALLDVYSLFVHSNPSIQDLVNAIQADKMLADMDVAATREIAAAFCQATEHFVEESLRERYRCTAFMMCHLTVSVVRLLLKVSPEEGQRIVRDFKASISAQVSAFIDVNATAPEQRIAV